jgi:hypothetical protein
VVLLQRLGAWLRWLVVDARWLWAAALPVITGVPLVAYLPCTKLPLAVLAGVLQFLGLWVAFASLSGDAKDFGRSLLEPFRIFWEKRPGHRRGVVSLHTVNLGTASMTFQVNRKGPPETQDVEERLKWVIARVVAVQEQSDNLASKLHQTSESADTKLKDHARKTEDALSKQDEKLKKHAVGGVHANLLGLWWVLLGTGLSLWASVFDIIHPAK